MKSAALAAAIAAIVTASAARSASADCAQPRYDATILTPSATPIGDDGGIVVAFQLGGAPNESPPDTWRFGTDKPAITAIAPGLAVYRPPTKRSPVVLSLPKGAALVTVPTTAHPAALAAPAVSAVQAFQTSGRHSSYTVYAVMSADPPRGAVALVASDKRGGLSFGTVTGNAKQLEIYGSSDCGPAYGDTIRESVGDTITLQWLDAAGTLSAATKPLKVTTGHN
jgi:hypothetical protein